MPHSAYRRPIADGTFTSAHAIDAPWLDRAFAPTPVEAVIDIFTIGEDSKKALDVLANDVGTGLKLVSVTDPGVGTIAIQNNKVVFDPRGDFDHLAAGEIARVFFDYTVRDIGGATATTSVEIKITGVNDAPVAPPTLLTTSAAAGSFSFDPVSFATDAEGDALHVVGLPSVARGTIAEVDGAFVYTFGDLFASLQQGQSDTITLRYKIADTHDAEVYQTVKLKITGVNDAPIAQDDVVTGTEDNVLRIDPATLLANDRDPDKTDTRRIVSVGNASHGTVALVNGTIVFTPDADFNGDATFVYTLRDARGLTDTGTVKVRVQSVDDPGVAVDDNFTLVEGDRTLFGNVIDGSASAGGQPDTDRDSAVIAIAKVNGQADLVGSEIALASGASLKIGVNGAVTFKENGAYEGLTAVQGAVNSQAVETATYSLSGGSTATVTVTIKGSYDATDAAFGSAGNDSLVGTALSDTILLSQDGADSVSAGGGNDLVNFGATFTAADRYDGGTGIDTLILQGAYDVDGFGANLSGVEVLTVLSGFDNRYGGAIGAPIDYSFIAAANLMTTVGQVFTVNASMLTAAESITFGGLAAGAGSFIFFGGLGGDNFGGSARDDYFLFGNGMLSTAADSIAGNGGTDTLALQGDYTMTLSSAVMRGIETVYLVSATDPRYPVPGADFDYDLKIGAVILEGGQLTVTGRDLIAGETMNVDASTSSASVRLIGGHDADSLTGSRFADILVGGDGDDVLKGGAGTDGFTGGAGADRIDVGLGADTVIFASAAESTGRGHDTLIGFNFAEDKIVLPSLANLHRDADVANAKIDLEKFDVGVTKAMNGVLAAGGASFVTVTDGTLAGHQFLVFDQNGTAGYQSGADLVIELEGASNIPAHGVGFVYIPGA